MTTSTIDRPSAAAVASGLDRLAAACTQDPLAFVRLAFPWGEPGPLAKEAGPRRWQIEAMEDIERRLKTGYAPDAALVPVLKAITSGHGSGKSAFIAWMALWALMTRPDSKVMITANTEQQVRTKTWPELAKWYGLCIFRDGFKMLGTSILSIDPDHEKTWRCDAVT